MEEGKLFKERLGRFAREAAYGAAIRHLTDLNYSPEEIKERLDYDVSIETIKRLHKDRLIQTGKLTPGTPEEKALAETGKYEYVKEFDRFGKAYWRRVEVQKR
ncbi:MAG: hypothetical protein IJU50_10160 [Lachnospiraceae bacterium]|nr:hypothetical protein [Lachnospiraceae bacterium]